MLMYHEILLTTCRVMFGNFFDVWNTMVHGKMLQRNAGYLFQWFLIFETFCPLLNFCILIQGLLRQHNGSHAKMSFNIPLLKSNSEFSCAEPCHAWQKLAWSLKNVCKNSGSFKISQKDILQLSKAFLHVQGCFIPQKNSRTSFYSWLKGFSGTSIYDRKISKQS